MVPRPGLFVCALTLPALPRHTGLGLVPVIGHPHRHGALAGPDRHVRPQRGAVACNTGSHDPPAALCLTSPAAAGVVLVQVVLQGVPAPAHPHHHVAPQDLSQNKTV